MANREQLLNDQEIAIRLALDGRQSTIWTALPGIVTARDLDKNTVSVQPTIKGQVTNEIGQVQSVNLPLLVDVPICWPKAGGFVLTLPINVDDEVLVIFSSRCIDAWWQSSGIQRAMEMRMHDLSDGFAIPGPSSVPKAVANVSGNAAQLRNLAGTTYIELSANGKIKLVSPAGIDVTGNLSVTGSVTSGTVNLATHVHSGVTTGGGTSGPPV